MKCGHDNNYRCPRCWKCYPCRHRLVRSVQWEGISVGWQCPNGLLYGAYGPSSPHYAGDA